ncbi:7 transmembrane receptor (rhodopsin family) [Nesidiocoris tenuis]|uniref:7 transmembrane receptor (Rhodopsin family) n=1 Tax=Nesidiocoris tenuis TaxID=355587 RepID=A0ABN7ADR1_9HEMI|nr:7 transmembrane receptor (rhodopsin family) [Nesidiocoris tenuis]
MSRTSPTPTTDIQRFARNSTREEVEMYIQKVLGPQRISLAITVPMTLIYAAIFITGVVGNVSICHVITKNQSMQTTTNYYLFSLAVSDLSLLVLGLPYDVSVYWQQYPWSLGTLMCKCRALVSEMASYTSVLTIVAFSMERYLAICHPLHAYSMSGLHRAVKIIAVLWIISLLGASPFAIFTRINYLDYPKNSGNFLDETGFCAMLAENVPQGFPIYELSFIIFFLVPMLIIIVLYSLIGRKIQSRGNALEVDMDGSVHRDVRHLKSRRNIVRMLMAVVITFFVCWFPFHAQRLFYLHGTNSQFYETINEWTFYITGILYYMSATMNPILYNLMSTKYRTAFKQTLSCNYRRSHFSDHSNHTREPTFRSTSIGRKRSRTGRSGDSFSSISTNHTSYRTGYAAISKTETEKPRSWRSSPDEDNLSLRPLEKSQHKISDSLVSAALIENKTNCQNYNNGIET